MVTGSLACIAYGTPRLTHDADAVIVLHRDQINDLIHTFCEPDYYCPPEDVIRIECARDQRGHFNVIHIGSGLKADFYVAGRDPLHAWALNHARTIPVSGVEVRVAPPEYVIVRKLEFFREGKSSKHLRDIAGILAVSGEALDRPTLQRLIDERHLNESWQQARDEDPAS